MTTTSTLSDLAASFRVLPVWFVIGAGCGGGAWWAGSSEWPARVFGFAFGVSTLILALLLALGALFFLARTTWKWAEYAGNDFENFAPWVLARLQRGVSALLGIALVALLAWWSVGSRNAAEVALLCLLFGGCIQFCAYCLQVLRSAHEQSRTTA